MIKNQKHGMYKVWIGLGEGDESNEKWAIANKTQARSLMQAMDEDVHVEQLMDDLFMPLDTKDPNVEAT